MRTTLPNLQRAELDMIREDTSPSSGRFKEFLKLQLRRQRFLTQEQEARLLEEAVLRYHLTADEANGALRAAADDAEVVTEVELGQSTAQLLKAMAFLPQSDPFGRQPCGSKEAREAGDGRKCAGTPPERPPDTYAPLVSANRRMS